MPHLPSQITAGESINIDRIRLPGYTPGAGWTVTFYFASQDTLAVEAEPTSDNQAWSLNVSSDQTLTLDTGRISYAAIAKKDEIAIRVAAGTLLNLPSPLKPSQWQKVIREVDKAILNFASSPTGSITIDGMSMTYRSMAELTRIREYAAEKLMADNGQSRPTVIRSRLRCI